MNSNQVKEFYSKYLSKWAEKYYRRHPRSAAQLASLFLKENDEEKAFEWWLRSARNGDANSQFNVALCYIRGKAVALNVEEAGEWFDCAARAGVLDAKRALQVLVLYGHTALKMSFKEDRTLFLDLDTVARAAAKAKDYNLMLLCGLKQSIAVVDLHKSSPNQWIVEAANRSHPDAQFMLAWWYHRVLRDYGKATIWYGKAVKLAPRAYVHYNFALMFFELGNYKSYAATLSIAANILKHTPAQLHLGRSYVTGKHIPKDTNQGIWLLQSAATDGCVEAMYELGRLYRLGGDGVKQDLGSSMEWYQRAFKLGETKASYWVAVLKGFHTAEGRECLEMAANAGSSLAQTDLGSVLAQEKKFSEAQRWFSKAAERGNEAAREYLQQLERFMVGREIRGSALDSPSWLALR